VTFEGLAAEILPIPRVRQVGPILEFRGELLW
jgi:hypothetical protein